MKNLFFLLLTLLTVPAFAQLEEKVGIGVRLQIDSTQGYKKTMVIGLVPEGPAKAAGILEGDNITKVNDQSTRDVALADVVNMIVGTEGSRVSIVVDRKGVTKTFSIERRKYKYATTYYQTAEKDDPFCNAIVTLMNDAPYDFKNTMDSTRYVDGPGAFSRRYYQSKIKVPGAEKTEMASSFGLTCEITIGSYTSQGKVNDEGEKLIPRLKNCFPDYYFNAVKSEDEDGSATIEIGKEYSNGFESAIIQIFSYFDKTAQKYKLDMRINGGKATRYYTITTAKQTTSFANAVRKIYDDIEKKYENVKGTRHETEGGFFSSSYWYEIVPKPDGAHDCSVSEGGMSLANGCTCRFFAGTNREAAVTSFNELYKQTCDALGSEFVYSFEASDLDMSIPKDATTVVVFGIKTKKTYESMPLLALVFVEDKEKGRYGVNMVFHDFGF